ncbi:MAG TPA: methyltransferase [Caulobacteraceae bacterium]|nr:methyltransferase [Caulobacteraceae bacterium]
MKRLTITALVGAVALSAGAAWQAGASGVAPNIAAAVADTNRPKDDTDLDAARKPAQMLAFARIKPGQTVVDFMPGKGYFSRLFSVAVGPKGKVYAFQPTEIGKFPGVTLPANGSQPDPKHPNITALVAPVNDFATPSSVDAVWTAQNYHDLHDPFMGPADIAAFNKAVFKALKPGGEFIVLDHAAAAGSGLRDTNTLHRIDPAAVKAEVEAAGFRFDGESKVLANPKDDHTLKVFDPSLRHHTDQFIYRFRKPA